MSYNRVLEKVAEAASKAGRRPEDVTLIVITKGRGYLRSGNSTIKE